MSSYRENQLKECSKEQLVYIIREYEKALHTICEICVDEGKYHIGSNAAIEEVRKQLDVLSKIDYLDLQNKLQFLMGEITVDEYRKRLGLD